MCPRWCVRADVFNTVCAKRPKASGRSTEHSRVCPVMRKSVRVSGRRAVWVCALVDTPRRFPAQTCNQHVSSRKQKTNVKKSRNKIGKSPSVVLACVFSGLAGGWGEAWIWQGGPGRVHCVYRAVLGGWVILTATRGQHPWVTTKSVS